MIYEYQLQSILEEQNPEAQIEALRGLVRGNFVFYRAEDYQDWTLLSEFLKRPGVPEYLYIELGNLSEEYCDLHENEIEDDSPLDDILCEIDDKAYWLSVGNGLTVETKISKFTRITKGILFLLFLAAFVLAIPYTIYEANFGPKSDHGMKKAFIAAVDAKYGEGIYNVSDCEKASGYMTFRDADGNQIGYIDKTDEANLYDNLELEKVNADLSVLISEMTGKEGMAFVGYDTSEDGFHRDVYKGDTIKYIKEGQVSLNGQIYIVFLYNGIDKDNNSEDENIKKKIETFEQENGIELFVIGIYDEYYKAIQYVDMRKLAINMGKGKNAETMRFDFPICAAFATEGYWDNPAKPLGEVCNYHVRDTYPVEDGLYIVPKTYVSDGSLEEEQFEYNFEVDEIKKELILTSPTGALDRNYYLIDRKVYNVPDNAEIYTDLEHGSVYDDLTLEDINTEQHGFKCYFVGDYIIIDSSYEMYKSTKIIIPYE